MPEISVIIPVYNAEKNIADCLESVRAQSLSDIEILCIDDGSTDKSGEILAEFSAQDPRIKIFRQPHCGAAAARDFGINAARGKYVQFLEGNNQLEKHACEMLRKELSSQNGDVCICQYSVLDAATGESRRSDVFCTYPGIVSESPISVVGNETVFFYADKFLYNKLYKTSFLKEQKIYFDTDNSTEGRLFYFRLLAANPLICCIDQPLVKHVVNSSSADIPTDGIQGRWEECLKNFAAVLELYPDPAHRRLLIDVGMSDLACLYESNMSALSQPLREALRNFFRQFAIKAEDYCFCSWEGFYRIVVNERPVIPVVFASNENYFPYLAVTISSLLENSSSDCFYDIVILYDQLPQVQKQRLSESFRQYRHAAFTFVNVNPYIDVGILYSRCHFTKEMYYRLLIPELLRHYQKAIYLDCDLLVLHDIKQLYEQNMEQNLLGAIVNYVTPCMERYIETTLKIDPQFYFNSGVLLFNLKECCRMDLKQKCLAFLCSHEMLACPDQDVLNVCCQGKIMFLDLRWNFYWQHVLPEMRRDVKMSLANADQYNRAFQNPYIIHYTTGIKPWNTPRHWLSGLWWQYAAKTVFYHDILYNNMFLSKLKEGLRLGKLKQEYWYYKILAKVTFGRRRRNFKQKRREVKQRIMEINAFLSN